MADAVGREGSTAGALLLTPTGAFGASSPFQGEEKSTVVDAASERASHLPQRFETIVSRPSVVTMLSTSFFSASSVAGLEFL